MWQFANRTTHCDCIFSILKEEDLNLKLLFFVKKNIKKKNTTKLIINEFSCASHNDDSVHILEHNH